MQVIMPYRQVSGSLANRVKSLVSTFKAWRSVSLAIPTAQASERLANYFFSQEWLIEDEDRGVSEYIAEMLPPSRRLVNGVEHIDICILNNDKGELCQAVGLYGLDGGDRREKQVQLLEQKADVFLAEAWSDAPEGITALEASMLEQAYISRIAAMLEACNDLYTNISYVWRVVNGGARGWGAEHQYFFGDRLLTRDQVATGLHCMLTQITEITGCKPADFFSSSSGKANACSTEHVKAIVDARFNDKGFETVTLKASKP